MKDQIKKLLSLFMAVLMCLSVIVLVSCDNVSEGGKESESESETAPVQNEIKIPVASLAEYYVVRPDIQNEELLEAVKGFNKLISEKLAVNTKGITTDFILEGNDLYKEHEYEIIIGATNREASAAFASELKYKEYGYAVVGTKIVIAGISVADTVLAIEKFIADAIDTYEAGSDSLVLESDKYICKAEFKFDTLSINGTDISEFDIVYRKTKKLGENEIAEKLQDSIGKLCGVKLNTVLMNTTSSVKTKQIVITESNSLSDAIKAEKEAIMADVDSSAKSVILADENIVWLCADSLAGMLDSVDKLIAKFDNSADGSITIESGLYDIANPQIKVMSYNVFVGTNTEKGLGAPRERRKGIATTIFNYAPDIIGIQEASNDWMVMLKTDLSSVYDYVGIGRESVNNKPGVRSTGEHCAIFYNKEKYNVIESNTFWLSDTPDVKSKHEKSEYIRVMTYAIFERKSDGYKFMHVNTHLDFDEKVKQFQISKMLEFIDNTGFDGLTFVTGDFNTLPSSASYGLMLTAGFENTFNVSNITSESKIDSMIDFCFVRNGSADSAVENHHVANDAEDKVYKEIFPSDHCAVIATIVPVINKD